MKKKNLFLVLPMLFGLASCTIDINEVLSIVENVVSEDIVITDKSSQETNSENNSVVNSEELPSETISETSSQPENVFVDYVSQTKLNKDDPTKVYAEVTVNSYVDGDTTHFIPKGNVSNWIDDSILKARYNSVDTPESTGKIEPWGKAASVYTHDALYNAKSIIIQSDTESWTTDSTGGRYLVWVWYIPKDGTEYRLLNLELIQKGYAKLKSYSEYSLAETFLACNYQAMKQEIGLYSKEKAPYYYDGDVQSISIKDLRDNPKDYEGVKVSVEGLITVYDANAHTAYAEAYSVEDDKYYGINIYCGFTTYTPIKVGNYLRISGTLQYYAPGADDSSDPEADGTWQISGLYYDPYHPEEPESMEIISKGNEVVPTVCTSAMLRDAASYESTYVSMDNLTVTKVYTTESTKITSNGALTITCRDSEGYQVTVRTNVLKKADKTLLTAEDVMNKTISVRGIVAKFNGNYQIKVFTLDDLEIA